MSTTTKASIEQHDDRFGAGFAQGFTESALRHALTKAKGEIISPRELEAAATALKGLPMEEIALRIYRAKAMPSGKMRLESITGRAVVK